MSNTNFPERKVHTVDLAGRTLKSTMSCNARLSTSDLTETSNAQKEVLHTLLCEMTEKSPPDSYRQYATIKSNYTIVEKTVRNCNYRIDNQMGLDVDLDPRLNIQYQIGRNSHAMVLVRMKPIECPPDIKQTVGLIDEDKIFGFTPKAVMGFIEKALKYSAANKCNTDIEWTIKEDERDRSRSRSGSRNRSRDRSRDRH